MCAQSTVRPRSRFPRRGIWTPTLAALLLAGGAVAFFTHSPEQHQPSARAERPHDWWSLRGGRGSVATVTRDVLVAGHTGLAWNGQRSVPLQFLAHAPNGADPVFEESPCPEGRPVPSGIDPAFIRCGSVRVPQNRDDPGARLAPIVLPVAVYEIPSARGHTPIVFLAGGPGESAISVVDEIFLRTPVGQLLMREHPVIAFDRRGFGAGLGRAVPDLGFLVYRPQDTRRESVKAIADTARVIADKLRSLGIEPKYFTTLRAIDDVRDVMRALGAPRAILFGTSYGTKEALQFMRRYPTMVEAAILDGVAPPQRDDIFDPVRLGAARRAVVARVASDCAADPGCGAEFSGLQALVAALDRADAPPVRVIANIPSAGGWHTLEISGRAVLNVLGAYAGFEPVRSVLPQLLEELAHGDTLRRSLSPQLVLAIAKDSALARTAGPIYPIVYHATLCGDLRVGVAQAGGRDVCDALGVDFSGPEAIAPVTSDAPVLLISSAYDAQTPPELAEEAARTLRHSFRVLFPGVGHLAYAREVAAACVAVVVQSFLFDPAHPPTDGCAGSVFPTFLPKAVDIVGQK